MGPLKIMLEVEFTVQLVVLNTVIIEELHPLISLS